MAPQIEMEVFDFSKRMTEIYTKPGGYKNPYRDMSIGLEM